MWAAIASMVIGLAGQAISTGLSVSSNNKQQKALAKQKAEDDLWYSQRYYEDPTTRADNAAILTQMEEEQKEQAKINDAKAKITGATQESKLASQDSMNKAYAGVIRNMVADNAKRKDAIGEQWRSANRENENALLKLEKEKSQSYANLASNSAKLVSNGISGIASDGVNINTNKNNTDINNTDITDSPIDQNSESNNGIDGIKELYA